MDDLEKSYKIEKMKRLKKSLVSLLLSPFNKNKFKEIDKACLK
jgi:hypothetical protein